MLKHFFNITIFFTSIFVFSQETKEINAIRIDTPPKIDGLLNDPVWENLEPYGNFYMFDPGYETKERETHTTQVKMAYDDKAIYFAAYIYDNEPDKILRQFSQRDNVNVQADKFSIALNTYNDGINETRFFVTSAGTIGDARSIGGEDDDFSYNVVFESNISFDEKGWYAEFKIPYNALRFPEVNIQDWSINFYREIRHLNETYVWNHVDRSVGEITQYNGLVKGVENIKPPLRLTLYPFAQGEVKTVDGDTDANFTAGMDIKYGISDSFTLDATLIPDFGQTAFDDVRLNLGPFEQQFDENRQFFIEGTELFTKGNLFYSRRIGGDPTLNPDDELLENEEVVDDPDNEKVGLLNAIKVSGRTKGNLGVGFFNAVTKKTEATIRDTINGSTRNVVTEPLANYNIFVLDQQFNQNSSVTLINTNVTRNGDFRDANVTGLLYDVSTKSNSYNIDGGVRMSHINDENNTSGVNIYNIISKTKGNFRWEAAHFFSNKGYDNNDLGIQRRNNFNNVRGEISYQIFEPTKLFNRYRIRLWAAHRRLYKPSVQSRNSIGFNGFFSTKNRFAFGTGIRYDTKDNNYFEPRVDGKFVVFDPNMGGNVWVSSDYRKKFAYDIRFGHRQWLNESFDENRYHFFLRLSPRYRFSDKFLVILQTEFLNQYDQFGYVDDIDDDVYFGLRDIRRIENSLNASYNFDPYKAINIRFRNFWSTANYKKNVFYSLNDDGSRSLTNYDISENDPNTNFNIWNIDMSFRWRFAPGSEAILLYRNQMFNEDELSDLGYSDSLNNLFEEPSEHTISLKIIYFLDVNNWKRSFKS